jgi:hypothetical protein
VASWIRAMGPHLATPNQPGQLQRSGLSQARRAAGSLPELLVLLSQSRKLLLLSQGRGSDGER